MRYYVIMATCCFLLLSLVFPTPVPAQVNIEKFRTTAKETGFSGFFELDLASRSGNVDITELTLDSRGDYSWETMSTFLIVRGDYGWAKGGRFSDEALGHVRQVFRSGKRIQPETFVQVDYNKKRLLNFRGLAGAGVRLSLFDHASGSVRWGTSFMLEHEQLDIGITDDHDKRSEVVRWSNYLTTQASLKEGTAWSSTVYIQPDIGAFDDVRVLLDTGLEVDLARHLALVVTFRLRYDSDPPESIDETDTRLGTGLAYRF